MSNRDSLGFGEMVPQDVVDIFAQEKHGKASRKKRSRSLGRAFGWLTGKKKKDHRADRQNAGLSPALDLAHPGGHKGGHKSGKHANAHGNSHVSRLDGDDDKTLAPPLFQENVFIESSRPKYLEDLHTEALEGLKMMQQEETTTGVEYHDNMSTASTLSVQTDGEGRGFTTDCTIPDSSSVVSMKSSASTKSSRAGLTRQGSTFRPLNSGKKSKTRKRHRKTVAGIPQHVQRELGLDRVGWVMPSKLEEEQMYNGESDYSTTSDSTLGPDSSDAAATSPETPNNVHPLSKDKVALLNAAHGNNLTLFHRLDQDFGSEPRSSPLAVPWMTSASSLQQELPSPVMSMSPQAAYMSKIIPNAVLPPSIDVVEISRGRSRQSVRTVSKSSLVLSSPAPSRASSRASSTKTTSSKASTITSASRQNLPHLSDSNWSNSDSSETLVSNSSTISNSSTPSQRRSHNGDAQGDNVGFRSNVTGEDTKKDGQFGRSLSIMKAKRAPPPPSRSYSLHNKMKRRSRDLAEVRVFPGEPPTQSISPRGEEKTEDKPGGLDSPGYHGDTSSLEDSPSSASPSSKKVLNESAGKDAGTENKLNMVSPSSGYSSQDASSPQASKLPLGSSPKHKRGILAKLQRLFPGSSSPSPPSSSVETPINTKTDTVDTVSPSVRALRELFNIPRHPKVHAPPPPPPEVWAHSRRSFELLLGPPAPDNVYAIIKKNPKDRRQQRASPPSGERKPNHVAAEPKKVQGSGVLIAEIHEENKERLTLNVESKESTNEKVSGSDILNGMLAKAVEKRKERLAARREEEVSKASGQNVDTSPAISLVRAPPSPAPPARHGPVPPPPATMSPESSWPPPPPPLVVSPLDELDFTLPLVLPVQVPPSATSQVVVVVTAPPPLNIPPPPSYTAPPPPASASPLSINKFPHSPKTNALPVIQEVVSPPPAPPPPGIFSLPPAVHITPTAPVTFVSRPEVVDVSTLPPDDIPPPPPQEGVRRLIPPESTPGPPPPLPPQPPPPPPAQLKVNVQYKILERSDSGLRPPDNIPPPPPVERLLHTSVLVAPPPPPAPPLLNVAALPPVPSLLIQHQPAENPTPEKTPAPDSPKDSSPIVTPSLLQMVKLRSVSSSPEPPKAEEQPKVEVMLRKKLPYDIVLTSSPGGEAPQKPVRRSLIVTSPTSPSPPTTATPPPTSPPVTVASASPSTVESSVEVSPPAPVVAAPASSPVPSGDEAPAAPPVAPPTVAPPISSTVTKVEISAPTTTVAVQSTSVPTTDSSVETPPPATPAAPPASPPTVKPVEDSPPAPADAAIAPPPSSTEDPPPAMTAVPPTSPPTPPPASTDAPVAPPPSSTVPPPVEHSPPPPMVAAVTPPPSSTEDSPPAMTAAPPPPAPTPPPASTAAPVAAPPPPSSSTVEKSPPATIVPPVIVTSSSSATAVSPVKKSPSATTAPPSMNLQEAIRLRTAARSKEAPASRLSMTSPTSPKDFRTSPTSTASFIFSKSNRKVVIETRPKAEVRGDAQRSPQLSPVATATPKVPPPVAKKPKSKSNEVEASEGTESSAETIRDVEEKPNGTAGGVEGGTAAT